MDDLSLQKQPEQKQAFIIQWAYFVKQENFARELNSQPLDYTRAMMRNVFKQLP